jgi:hypothetical protein
MLVSIPAVEIEEVLTTIVMGPFELANRRLAGDCFDDCFKQMQTKVAAAAARYTTTIQL